jgi:hypothetical protein
MAKQKLTKCEIRWIQQARAWRFLADYVTKYSTVPNDGLDFSMTGENKAAFVRRIVAGLKQRIANGEYGFSLRIYDKDGRVQEERTYPRSADPKKSKG